MTDGRIKIELESRIDSQGNKYLIGKLKAPIIIDCEKGACFLIFYSESGSEELQIAPLDSSKKIKEPKIYKTLKKSISDE